MSARTVQLRRRRRSLKRQAERADAAAIRKLDLTALASEALDHAAELARRLKDEADGQPVER